MGKLYKRDCKTCISGRRVSGRPCRECGRTKPFIRKSMSWRTRFWLYVKKGPGCWVWTGSVFVATGHAQYNLQGYSTHAARYAYELTKGRIPKKKVVRHTCDNGLCVNPKHLILGTMAENNRDMWVRGRSKTNKVSVEQVREIRRLWKRRIPRDEICQQVGTTESIVYRIVTRRTWTWVK